MTVLGIDASGEALAVGLLRDGAPLGQVLLVRAQAHSRVMVRVIRDLLRDGGVRPRDLGLVAVAAGPGSYTGLRLAATAAKALAWSAGCPVAGVDSMAVLAAGWAAAGGGGVVAALLPARRGQLYGRLYGASWPPVPQGPLLEGEAGDVISRLLDDGGRAGAAGVACVGEGALAAAGELAARGASLPPDPSLHYPQGLLVARLGLLAAERGEAEAPEAFLPRYAGPPPAVPQAGRRS